MGGVVVDGRAGVAMMELPVVLPPPDLLVPFLIAGLALNLTPGPDMTYVATVAGRSGWRAGVVASLGIAAGCLVHITMAVAGLSGLLAASEVLFSILRVIGAGYLAWIAIGLLRGGASDDAGHGQPTARGAAVFRQGMMVNVLNPKVGLFFLAFLPQFVDPSRGYTALQLLTLGLIFNVGGTVVNAVVSIGVDRAARRASALPRAAAAIRWCAGSALLYFAFRLARSRR